MDKFTEEMIEKVALERRMDKEVVRKIVNFQFKDMLRAARTARTIEMTWFGKWYASNGKCKRKLEHYQKIEQAINDRLNSGEELSERKISSYNSKLRVLREIIEFIRSKMDHETGCKRIDGGNLEPGFCEAAGRESSDAAA